MGLPDGNMREIQHICGTFHLNLQDLPIFIVYTTNVLDNVQKSGLLLKMNSAFCFETIVSERPSLLIVTDCKLKYSESQTTAC